MQLPSFVSASIAAWLRDHGGGPLRDGTAAMRAQYQRGKSSREVDIASYLVTRAPATFSAVHRAIEMCVDQLQDFSPRSILDVGAGAGSATWAALDHWSSLEAASFLDNDERFLNMARVICSASENVALERADFRTGEIGDASLPEKDVVVASYVFAERPADHAAQLALRMWDATRQLLLIVEPGTPAGFDRIKRARAALSKASAQVVAPCTHDLQCPIIGEDWCHFNIRLPRSRAHMHAKAAVVPYEDEPFTFIAVARDPPRLAGARVIAPSEPSKAGIAIRLCSDGKVFDRMFTKRDANVFKRVRKIAWGDTLPRDLL